MLGDNMKIENEDVRDLATRKVLSFTIEIESDDPQELADEIDIEVTFDEYWSDICPDHLIRDLVGITINGEDVDLDPPYSDIEEEEEAIETMIRKYFINK